jgi:hypothetical protein
MIHRALWLIIGAAAALGCAAHSRYASPELPAQPTFHVSPTIARFVLPVGRQEVWRWYLATTADNRREYRWEVALDTGQTYGFGFSLWKVSGAALGTGSLAALVDAGQKSVWERDSTGGFHVVSDAAIEVAAADSVIVIAVANPRTLDLLFGTHPPLGTMILQAPGQQEHRTAIHFAYDAH